MNNWNANQYLKFKKERTQPAIDLTKRIEMQNPKEIIDIGCGPGNSTKVLSDIFPDSFVTGADNSPEMLKAASKTYPELNFIMLDAASELENIQKKYDIVFSNACIQWIPDHDILLKNMMDMLNDGGTLAVQVPMNFEQPIHKIIRHTAESEKWSSKIMHMRVFHTLDVSGYHSILSQISSDFTIWETIYMHRMESHQSIIEWYRGTGMRPYLSQLSDDDKAEFENDILSEIKKQYIPEENGEIIFKFSRLFFISRK